MPRFEYKDGCLLCNQCGRLYEKPDTGAPELLECPCGNSERLDAIDEIAESYNPPPAPAPAARHEERAASASRHRRG